MFDIVVVAEDESDARRVQLLIDRVLLATIDWLGEQPALLDSQRRWRGVDESTSFIDVHVVHDLADRADLPRPRGHFDGRPPAEDFHCAVRTLWLLEALGRPRIVAWVRDTDGSAVRQEGWAQACQHAGSPFELAIAGFPHECMEAWLLAAWSPTSPIDHTRVERERQRLGFWPHLEPERLSHADQVPKSAKAVCRALEIDDDVLRDTNLDALRQRGSACGATEFLTEVMDRLVPAIRRP